MSSLPSAQSAVAAVDPQHAPGLERARRALSPARALAYAGVDAAMLVAAVCATLLGSTGSGVAVMPIGWLVGFATLFLALAWMRGLYEPRLRLDPLTDLRGVFVVTTLAVLLTLSLRLLVTGAPVDAAELIRPWAFVIAYTAVGRMALQWSQLVRVQELPAGVLGGGSAEASASRGWDFVRGISGTVAKGRGWLLRRTLAMADIAALVLAFLIPQWALGARDAQVELLLFLLTIPVWIVAANAYGLYKGDEEHADHSTLDEVPRVLHLVTLGAWLVFLGTWALGVAQPDFAKLALFWALAIALVTLARCFTRALCRRSALYVQNTVIVGAGDVGQLIARKFLQHPECGVNVVGFVDDAPREREQEVGHLAVLGAPEALAEIVRRHNVDRVVIAFSNEPDPETLGVIRSLRELDVKIDIVPRLFEVLGPNASLHGVGGLPLVGLPQLHLSRRSRALKRGIDVVLSTLGLVLLGPAFAAIAVAIKLNLPGPVFFRQTRMGAGDRTFEMFKFRTMTVDADAKKGDLAHLNKHNGRDPRMFKIVDDPRVTAIGRFLRRYSLDELPQLLNVVRGDMTLVGPRPLILEEDQHVREWARKRLDLKPGMTGRWQTLGRSDIPFEEMIKLDYLYVTDWSPWGDLKLMLQTIPAVIRSRSVVY